MKIRVLSKNHFDDVLPRMRITNESVSEHLNEAFISILNSDMPNSSYFDKDYPNVLRLVFDDITDREQEWQIMKGSKNTNELILFNRKHANKIIEFVEQNKHVDTMFVHCTAGVSRSGAVGTFINDIAGEQTFFKFTNSNSQIKPNFYILALLRRVYNKIEDDE